MNTEEKVNHPSHYRHPYGYECIDLIRHYVCDIAMAIKYLWRAGVKTEEGMTEDEKEMEDLKKAIWYIDDYRQLIKDNKEFSDIPSYDIHPQGINIDDITEPYAVEIADAITNLSLVGFVYCGKVTRTILDEKRLDISKRRIEERLEILQNRTKRT